MESRHYSRSTSQNNVVVKVNLQVIVTLLNRLVADIGESLLLRAGNLRVEYQLS